MPAYVVIEVLVTEPDLYEQYRHKLPPTMAAFGGVPLVRGFTELLDGNSNMDRMSIIEFPDRKAATAWYNSSDVKSLNDERRAASEVIVRIIEEV